MGNTLSAKRERIQVVRNVVNEHQRSCNNLTHAVEVMFNEQYIGIVDNRYVRNTDQQHARCEDGLSSAFIESSSLTTEEEEKCYDIQDATLTFVDGDDVLDFLCADYKSRRAKMSCGHAVTPMSLTDWCRRQLDNGGCKFVCGQTGCDVEWPFEEVCKMALLTPKEIEEFEKKMFQNAANFLDIKFCPGCKSRVMRTDLNNLSVLCTVCTAKKGRIYTFCWQCLKEWKSPTWSKVCGNNDCYNPLKILKRCPHITFEDVEGVTGCPCIRACPTCGLLLEHNRSYCKNVVCVRCKVEFCFVCLKLTEVCVDEDNITSYFTLCSSGVAPRQTSIPVWQRT